MSKLNKLNLEVKETGKILENTKEVVESIVKEEFIKRKNKLLYMLNNSPEKLSSSEIEEAVKYYNKNLSSIKQFDFFDEYYTGNKVKLKNSLDLVSDAGFKCFNRLVVEYTSCENTIQFKNNTNVLIDEDFSEILNISNSKWRRIKKELIENNWIRKIEFDKKKLYKINPMVIGHSMKITKCTYYAFRNELIQEFDYIKSLYWDKLLIEEYGADIFDT